MPPPHPAPEPGKWLFHRDVLGWLSRPNLRRQLPVGFRLFAAYAWGITVVTRRRVVAGGPQLFRLASSLHGARGRLHPLNLPSARVWLHLADPRFLNVVRSLLNSSKTTPLGDLQLTPGDTFVDIGANHGEFAIRASRLVGPGGRVIAVEAQPILAEAVRRTLSDNAFSPFTMHAVAVGNRNDRIDLHIPLTSSGAAGIYENYSATAKHYTLSVPLRRFDDLIADSALPGVVTVKLDIEGSEPEFLRGARDFIIRYRPRILMEINPRSLTAAGTSEDDLKAILLELGYSSFTKPGDALSHPTAKLGFDVQQNIILVPDQPRNASVPDLVSRTPDHPTQ